MFFAMVNNFKKLNILNGFHEKHLFENSKNDVKIPLVSVFGKVSLQ